MWINKGGRRNVPTVAALAEAQINYYASSFCNKLVRVKKINYFQGIF